MIATRIFLLLLTDSFIRCWNTKYADNLKRRDTCILTRCLVFVLFLYLLSPLAQAATIPVSCPGASLQAAVNLAAPGDSISVSGTCNENILVRNEKQRIAIDGGGTATINGPSSATPTINVRGKGITIQGLNITGGSNGIEVNRGSNAVINNNIVHATGGAGVVVYELAFAVITNNTIQDNPEDGIMISESSASRIGFNNETDIVASANTIQSNNGRGISLFNNSSARIVGNTISGNAATGILVRGDSHADIAGNQINGNGGDGITVIDNSSVSLGETAGSTIFDLPNSTSLKNAGFGFSCSRGCVASGVLGTLNGTIAATTFDLSSTNHTILNPSAPLLSIEPANGATVNTTTPLITISYSDPGSAIDLNSLSITINGVDSTGLFTKSASTASLQTTAPLPGGQNIIAASIQNQIGNMSQAESRFMVSVFRALPDASPINGTAPLAVKFTTKGEDTGGPIVRYRWDFEGDGTFDTSDPGTQDFTFTYNNPGVFHPVLEVMNNRGEIATASLTITVTAPGPIAIAAATPTNGAAPLAVTFSGAGEKQGGEIVLHEWDFDGDGIFDFQMSLAGTTLFSDNFESGVGGWTHGGTLDQWQLGAPTSGPGKAFSGTNVWATNLSGDYSNSANNFLLSPAITLGLNSLLTFQHFFDAEQSFDGGVVEVTTDGTNFTKLSPAGGYPSSVIGLGGDAYSGSLGGYTKQTFDLSALANQTVQIRFRFVSDFSVTAAGWYIDDFKIVDLPIQPSTILFSDDFESGAGGWTHGGTSDQWQLGNPTSGPNQAFSGTNVWATNLAGPYSNNTNNFLLSPPITLGLRPVLTFQHFLDAESTFDGGVVEITTDGTTFTKITPAGGYPSSISGLGGDAYSGSLGGYTKQTFDLSDFAGQTVQIRFHFFSDSSVTAAGWYIDDFKVVDSAIQVAHTYNNTGTFHPVFRVTDNESKTATKQLDVRVGPPGSPTVAASASATKGTAPLTVNFGGTAIDPGGTIVKYEWDFDGDGIFDFSSTTSPNTSFTYSGSGTFKGVLRVTDNNGNTSFDTVEVTVDLGVSLSVAKANNTLRPLQAGTAPIQTSITGASPVSIRIKNKAGQVVRTLINNVTRSAGSYTDLWDGKNDGGLVVPEGVYYAVLEYIQGGQANTLDLTNTTGGTLYNPDRTIQGQNCFDCVYVINPFQNQFLNIAFTIPDSMGASEVTPTIIFGPFLGAEPVVTLLNRQPFGVGTHTIKWDGTDATGQIVVPPPGKTLSLGVIAFTLPDNGIFVESAPQISNVSANPNFFDPSTGDFISPSNPTTTITYDLSGTATIALQVINTDTNRLVRTITNANVGAGTHTIAWDGRNDSGIFVDAGDYRLGLKAADSSGGQSLVNYVLVKVFY